MKKDKLMEEAVEIAQKSAMDDGGPFGAIIVKDGKVIGTGRNEVTAVNDPTAHAEIQAIRAACSILQNFQLSDCEIYTSCEPCPMCLSAIYWARIKTVYYASTKKEAAQIGFDDQFIYEQIAIPYEKRSIKMKQICPDNYNLPFKTWENSNHRIDY